MPSTESKSHEVSWSMPVIVAELHDSGFRVSLEANEAERTEIAHVAGLRDLSKLSATFELTPLGHDKVRLVGQVDAVVGQSCVVTLDPVENTLSEPVNLIFAPASTIVETPETGPDDAPSDDPPEPIIDGRIDLARLAVEFLILGIDPYPRKAGAAFEPVSTPPAPEDHPFAGLAALKEPKMDAKPAKSPQKRP
jgi:uncharacterized metal-binding protein YceD (DUF177 family)